MTNSLLKGQIALVTGSNRGIGKQISIALAQAGATVFLAARNVDSLASSEQEILSRGGVCHKIELDVTDKEQVKKVIDHIVEKHGRLDLLVNNAGIGADGILPWEQDVDEWWSVQEVNVRGAYLCSHAALGHMIQQGSGRIVDIGSLIGATSEPMSSAYAVSKSALFRLSSCLAAAAKDYGVSIFVVSPGLVATDMTSGSFFENIPPDQWTPIEKCGELVVALASGKADKLTGRFIHAALDDLDDLLKRSDEILDKNLLTLGMFT